VYSVVNVRTSTKVSRFLYQVACEVFCRFSVLKVLVLLAFGFVRINLNRPPRSVVFPPPRNIYIRQCFSAIPDEIASALWLAVLPPRWCMAVTVLLLTQLLSQAGRMLMIPSCDASCANHACGSRWPIPIQI